MANETAETLTIYEEPRDVARDLVLAPSSEAWMILCRRPGPGPCSATIRAVSRSGKEVFCRRYSQDELSRTGRVAIRLERTCV